MRRPPKIHIAGEKLPRCFARALCGNKVDLYVRMWPGLPPSDMVRATCRRCLAGQRRWQRDEERRERRIERQIESERTAVARYQARLARRREKYRQQRGARKRAAEPPEGV